MEPAVPTMALKDMCLRKAEARSTSSVGGEGRGAFQPPHALRRSVSTDPWILQLLSAVGPCTLPSSV